MLTYPDGWLLYTLTANNAATQVCLVTLFNDNSISVHCARQAAVPIHTKEGSYHWTASNGEISILHPLKEGCVRSLQRVLLDSELAKWRAAHVTVQRIRGSDISLDPA